MQTVTFDDSCDLESLVRNVNFGNSTLSRWLISNRWDPDGRHLTYSEYPLLYAWNTGKKEWIFRTKNHVTPIGRMVYVHPTAGELFYLRILLCHQKGCQSFSDSCTVNGVVYSSHRLACEALGLTGDDKEWLTAFTEASLWASSSELRSLFCNLLLFCDVGDPKELWNNAWQKMGDDIIYDLSNSAPSSDCVISEHSLQQHILFELERQLNATAPPKTLTSFGLPLPSSNLLVALKNRLLLEETLYDKISLAQQHLEMSRNLNPEQLRIYNRIRNDELLKKQTLLFVYGHGGTGKTYLWSTILAYFRSTGKVVLAVASSGVASLLLPNGRTAHSRFNIPINLADSSVCNIKKRTQLAELLEQTYMIIWDEATMIDRRCFECVDRTFRDILENMDKPFGGLSMLLGGDFRQTLPIKRKKGHKDIMLATLPNSYLWPQFALYKLSYNMRLSRSTIGNSICTDSGRFAQWLLDVGNGILGTPDVINPRYASHIQIPDCFLITDSVSSLQQLIDFVYEPAENMVHIKDLEYGCAGSPIDLRILRKWTPHFRNKEPWFLAVDEHGDSVTILGEHQGQKFLESKIRLTLCYTIQQYSCTETPRYQRIIRNPIHLNAGEASKVTAIEDKEEIPRTYFDFAPIDQLYAFLDKPTYYPDFLGKYKRQTLSNKKNGDPLLLLTLTEAVGQEMTVTIWKECMENSDKIYIAALSTATPDTVIAVTNVKPAVYTGALKMSSTDATYVIIDPPLLTDSTEYQQMALTAAKSSSTTSYAIMTLDELQSKQYETILRKVIATDARIIDTNIENSWYTATCPDCKSQISKQKDTWFCPNHGSKSNPNFFYNVKVVLSDGTANLEATATDSCMQRLIGRTCTETIMEDGYEDRKTMPPSFKKDGMNTHRFHIEMTKKSTPTNINFIIVNKEQLLTQSPPPQPTALTITPPPHTPTTPNIEKNIPHTNEPTTEQNKKAPTARQLSFEPTEPTDPEGTATASSPADTIRKRKPTQTTDKIVTLNPTKRERFPE